MGYPEYDAKIYLMDKLHFLRSEQFEVPLHCYDSQVNFEPELVLLLMVDIYGSNTYQ